MKHLKPKQYYRDLYDNYTIEELLQHEDCLCSKKENLNKDIKKEDGTLYSKKEKLAEYKRARHIILWFIKGQRYLDKNNTIQKWMDNDKEQYELLENAIVPQDIYCENCGLSMELELKDLDIGINKPDRILFIFRCKTCRKGKGIYNTGEELKNEKTCSKCNTNMDAIHKRYKKKITTTYTCSSCNQKYTDSLVLSETTKKKTPTEEEIKKFEHDRKRFCLSEFEGEKFREAKKNLDELSKVADQREERNKNKKIYDKVESLKKLTISQIKDLLEKSLEKNNYIELQFAKPEFGKYVIVDFTCMDKDDKRDEYKSKQNLKKIINDFLSKTIWRLMSDGINYRIGYLSGRIKAFENEEELKKLIS